MMVVVVLMRIVVLIVIVTTVVLVQVTGWAAKFLPRSLSPKAAILAKELAYKRRPL
ncbi:hypothetical protein [Cereibacter changlensis]|uniref:hypothetical protein n=1 Tax=Cereibacter changlensis TaxID=402884 RepID=UPI00145D627A|nr:hypothetical protein [Cereibacter changlensis]